MDNEITFDVIIPAYNAHKTIGRTLMSLGYQSLAHLLNVYIIDDGSDIPYNEEYKKFNNYFKSFHIFREEKNRGVGVMRNIGLEKSKEYSNSPWIFFIDSDDYCYNPYTFNYFYKAIKEHPKAKYFYSGVAQEESDLTNPNTELKYMYNEFGSKLYLHGKIFNRAAIEKLNLRFPPYRSNEDIYFNLTFCQYYNSPENIIFISEIPYLVCTNYNLNSITRSGKSTRASYYYDKTSEYYDNYLAALLMFQILKDKYNSEGIVLNPKNCNYYIDAFLHLCLRIKNSKFEFQEEKEFVKLIAVKYYKDIIQPLYNNLLFRNSKLQMNWYNTPNNYGFTDYEKDLNIIMQDIKEKSSNFNESYFNELLSKYYLEQGYF